MSIYIMKASLAAVLMLATFCLPVDPPDFEITKVDKSKDAVTIEVQTQRVIFTAVSSDGIGGFTATLKLGQWPRDVSVIINRKNLEAFGFRTDHLWGQGGMKSGTNCWTVFEFRDEKRDSLEDSFGISAGSLNMKTRQTNNGIELIFPTDMFLDSKQFSFSWTDAFRR